MPAPGDDRFFTELRGCTAELARITSGDLERPVPSYPGWTFRQLVTHVGRGHRWAAQIVATRAATPMPVREVADGKLPPDPAQHASWLNAGADRVIDAVMAAGSDLVWTLAGIGPASCWARRRAQKPPFTWRTLSSRPDATSISPRRLPRTALTNGSPSSPPAPREPPTRPVHRRKTCAATARACISTPPTPGCPAPTCSSASAPAASPKIILCISREASDWPPGFPHTRRSVDAVASTWTNAAGKAAPPSFGDVRQIAADL